MVNVQRKSRQQHIEELSEMRTKVAGLETALAEQAQDGRLASAMLDAMPMRISYIDSERRYQFTNRVFHEWSGRPRSEIKGKPMVEVLGEVAHAGAREFVEAALAGQSLSFTYRDGAIYAEVTYTPDFGPDGEVRGLTSSVEGITERREAERQQRRYEDIVSSSADMLALLDRNYVYKAINHAYATALGPSIEHVLGHTVSEVAGDEFFNTVIKPNADRCLRGEEVSYQGWFDFAILGRRYVDVRYYPHRSESGKVVGFVVCSRDITKQQEVEAKLRESHEQLRNLSASLRIAREEERTQIAREIHDELGQSLTALKMDLAWLNKRLGTDQAALSMKISAMNDLVDDSIRTVQTVSTGLRPSVLDDFGIAAAIEWQTAEFKQRTGVRCRTRLTYDDPSLNGDIATTIFRVFQEALTNIARHSEATGISVALNKRRDSLALTVRDNGRGITREQIISPESVGLIGMRERARSCGGEVRIVGREGKGTEVQLIVPLDQDGELQ